MTAVAMLPDSEPSAALPATRMPASAISLADALRLLWRRKALLGAIVIVGTGIATAIAFSLQPRYLASTEILLDPRQQDPEAARSLSASLGIDRASVFNEIEILRSPMIAEKVIDRLGLWSDPEFGGPGDSGPTIVDRVTGFFEGLLGLVKSPERSAGQNAAATLRDRLMVSEAFRRKIAVRPLGQSFMVDLQFDADSPEKAALVANTIVSTYIAEVIEDDQRREQKRRDWLATRVVELRKNVVDAESAVAEMTVRRGIAQIGQVTITDRQITETSAELARARAHRGEVAARLGVVLAALSRDDGGESVAEVQSSNLIQQLKEQEAIVLRRIGELDARFGARHPKMIDARAELADLRAKIHDEMGRIIQRLRDEQKIAEAREASLTTALTRLQDEQAHQVRDQVLLHELKRKAELNRKLYEEFLAKVNLATQTTTRQESHVRVISAAQPPVDPSYPRKPVIVALGLVLSGAIGVFLILLTERLRTGFRTPSQVEQTSQLSLLGTVPRLPRRFLARRDIADYVVEAAGSSYAEAIRSLRTALSVCGPKGPPKVLLVASSLSGEGKTSLVVSLARQAAQAAVAGSVILVDCDLRRPKVAAAMGLECKAGLMQLFAREAELGDVILEDPKTGLNVIPAVAGTPNPPELLNSVHMRDLLQELTRRYDLVILDSPALNSVSDARVLAQFADATIFVVQWETTPRNVALAAIRQLQSAGAAIAGVVLHKVDGRTLGLVGYGEASDYQP